MEFGIFEIGSLIIAGLGILFGAYKWWDSNKMKALLKSFADSVDENSEGGKNITKNEMYGIAEKAIDLIYGILGKSKPLILADNDGQTPKPPKGT